MSLGLSPIGNDAPFVDANGDPLSGGKLYVYLAGSATPATTYQDAGGTTPNANPIVLNSNGYPASGGNVVEIWLTDGASYLFELKTSADVLVWSRDDIEVLNDTSVTIDQWVSGPAPTYIGATSFSLVGDQTSTFHVGRRVKTSNTGGTIYSTITASAYTSLTTITVANDSGSLDSGLSGVSYGLLSADNPSTPLLDDTYPVAKGSSDETKKVRLEVDSITTATTRVITVPNKNSVVGFPKGHLFGCVMTNGSDATNDIDFAAGEAIDSTGVIDIIATSGITKRIDAAWAAGTNQGGLMSAAALTNTTYHCYIIRKDSDGTADFGFDVSATAPTMPAGYTYFRRIGSICRVSGAIALFSQRGNEFIYKAMPAVTTTNTLNTTAQLLTLAVPVGIQVTALYNLEWGDGDGATYGYVSSPDQNDEAASGSIFTIRNSAGAAAATVSPGGMTRTNTSGQVRAVSAGGTGNSTLSILPWGWIDTRGRDS